jgi:hypothetical protein
MAPSTSVTVDAALPAVVSDATRADAVSDSSHGPVDGGEQDAALVDAEVLDTAVAPRCDGGTGSTPAPAPTITPGSEIANNDVVAEISAVGTGTICYTLDGTIPSCALCTSTPPVLDPTVSIVVGEGGATIADIQAIFCPSPNACLGAPSPVVNATYELQVAAPTMSNPSPGVVPYTGQGVTENGEACSPVSVSATPPCLYAAPTVATITVPSASPSLEQIRYTIAPAEPPTCSAGTPIGLDGGASGLLPLGTVGTVTIQVIACKSGYTASQVVDFTFRVEGPPTDGG